MLILNIMCAQTNDGEVSNNNVNTPHSNTLLNSI